MGHCAVGAIAVLAAVILCSFVGVNAQYQPTWESLNSRPLPGWYDDSKFGIFIHWGVFSVPSWGVGSGGAGGSAGEWFWYNWQGPDPIPAYAQFIANNYAPGWTYADFAPLFTAKLFNATQWAEILAGSGAKYVVLTTKHHEGYCMYNCTAAAWNWNSLDVGPNMDLLAALSKAVNATGLHMGAYHSLFEWFNPFFLADQAANWTTNTYVTDVLMPELKALVNNYQPQVIWSDGDWMAPDTYWQSKEFLAWLYNESPVKDFVVVNDRWGINDTCVNGGYYTCSDRYNPGKLQNHKWENCFTIDEWSWGWRRNAQLADFLSTPTLLYELVSTVAFGGNLLLNIGPTHDGTIPIVFQERLAAIGQWFKVNGQAIYATKPWRAQNDTANLNTTTYYTQNKATGAVAAIFLTYPSDGVLTLTQPLVTSGQTPTATLLGYTGTVTAVAGQNGKGLSVKLPSLSEYQQQQPNAPFGAWTLILGNVE